VKRIIAVIDTDIYDGDDAKGCNLTDAATWIEIMLGETHDGRGGFVRPHVEVTAYQSIQHLVDDHADRLDMFDRYVEPLTGTY
jgi:hypothetical protein